MPQVVDILEGCPQSEHAWPFALFIKGPLPHGRDFLRFAKFGTLQYSVVKPFAAFVALLLAPFGLYKEVGSCCFFCVFLVGTVKYVRYHWWVPFCCLLLCAVDLTFAQCHKLLL